MIVLDTDTLTLYFASHAKVMAKVQAATEAPVTSIVSRIEVLKGRFDSVLKAADGDQLLVAQRRLRIAELDLAKFTIILFDAAGRSRVRPTPAKQKAQEDRPAGPVDRLHCPGSPGDLNHTQPARLSARAGSATGELGRLTTRTSRCAARRPLFAGRADDTVLSRTAPEWRGRFASSAWTATKTSLCRSPRSVSNLLPDHADK